MYRNVLTQFQGKLAERLNVEQMFILIDGVLPFEACLYHQVLPLFVEGSRLNLGMVSPNDVAAMDYARRMLSYVNYSLSTHQITSAALQAALSAYLNYVSMKRSQVALPAPSTPAHPPDEDEHWRSPDASIDQSDRQTFILDEADLQEHEAMLQAEQNAITDELDLRPEDLAPDKTTEAQDASPTVAGPLKPQVPLDGASENPTKIQTAAASPPPIPPELITHAFSRPIPILRIHAPQIQQPIEQLQSQLDPNRLIQELLVRVLESGIGRLYFERQKRWGRVLWSQNGVLKAVLDQLELSYCQALIDELKALIHIPIQPSETPQQVEVERVYESERLLLRCRFMRGVHGEEATIQVLRGVALKFYEQQQIARLGSDALTLAHELQHKLDEIRSRALLEPASTQSSLRSLHDLQQALNLISKQIHDLQSIQSTAEE